MQPRGEQRFRKRIPCRLSVADESYAGMVLNVSRGGLFVQTGAKVGPGDGVRIDLNVSGAGERIPIDGRVVWKRVVAAHLRALSQGGVGLRIHTAPESYYQLLLGMADAEADRASPASAESTAAAPKAQPPAAKRFRVRVKQENGPRSLVMTVRAATRNEAATRVLAEVGADWVVLEIERL